MSHDKDLPRKIRMEIRQGLKQIVGPAGSRLRRIQLEKLGYDPDTLEKAGEEKPTVVSKKKGKKKFKAFAAAPVNTDKKEDKDGNAEASQSSGDSNTGTL